MKREQEYTFLQAMLLSWGAALGGLGMMVSGLDLTVSLFPLAILSLVAAFGLCLLLHQPKGLWIALGLEAAVWLLPSLRLQLKALGRSLVRYMTMAYGVECPDWLTGERPGTLLPLFLVLGSLIMLPWIYSVLKGKTAAPAIGAWLVPLFFCITVTDTVPSAPWLFLWLLSLVLLLMTVATRRHSKAQGNRLLLLVLVPSVLGLALLFWLIPEEKANDWQVMSVMQDVYDIFAPDTSWKNSDSDTDTGEDMGPNAEERVNLGTMKERNPSDREIMDVITQRSGVLYLRGRDYDQYTGLSWESTEGRLEVLGMSDSMGPNGGSVTIETKTARDYYFAPYYLNVSPTLDDGKLVNPRGEKKYTFFCRQLWEDWATVTEACMASYAPGLVLVGDMLINVDEDYQYQKMLIFYRYGDIYLQLPQDTRALATNYLSEAGFPFEASLPEQAKFIENLVRSSARYDLKTGKMPDDRDDLALWFLQESETGYCVHFATAAAVLLRAAGIPARYVEGYMVDAQAYTVTTVEQRNGHGWVEYYAPGVGWLILEATPADGVADTATVTTTEPTEPSTTEPSETTDPRETTEPTEPSTTEPTETEPQQEQEKPVSLNFLKGLVPVAVMLLLFASVFVRYRLLRRQRNRKLSSGSTNARAIACYRELRRLSKYLNLPIPENVTTVAEKAKFSPHRLTKEELKVLYAHLGSLRQDVRNLPPGKRLIAKWIWALM